MGNEILKKSFCIAAATLWVSFVLAISGQAMAQSRAWTSADGARTFQGKLESYDRDTGTVTVTMADGRKLAFSRDKLSDADRIFLEKAAAAAPRTNSLGKRSTDPPMAFLP